MAELAAADAARTKKHHERHAAAPVADVPQDVYKRQDRGRVTYNELCRKCQHGCKQSFRAVVTVSYTHLQRAARKEREAAEKRRSHLETVERLKRQGFTDKTLSIIHI